MARNPEHTMLLKPGHDDRARQDFIGAFKRHLSRNVRPANRKFFETEAKPEYLESKGRPPVDTDEIREAMTGNPHWQIWSILNNAAQRQMWAAVNDMLQRNEEHQRQTYSSLIGDPHKAGSLELDPDLRIPEAIRSAEIHLQPGGYALDRGAGDFRAGVLYEAGGMLYSRGQGVGTGESKADVVVRFLAERYPDFTPKRILDMACSAGASSTPYADTFPDSEVFAIDVAPGLLRYAHARAEALGVRVHFLQRDVADTRFADDSFDLVVSHNAMHEMSAETTRGMFRESYRILKPGGICVHQDVPLRYSDLDNYGRFEFSWDQYFNGEIFWGDYCGADLADLLARAGFPADDSYLGYVDQADGSMRWYIACARKPEGTRE